MNWSKTRHGLVCTILSLLVACGSSANADGSNSEEPEASGTKTAVGTLSGVVRLYGGPFGPVVGPSGPTRGTALNGDPAPNETFYLTSELGERIAVTSDASGNFSTELPTGSYIMECRDKPDVAVQANRESVQDCGLSAA